MTQISASYFFSLWILNISTCSLIFLRISVLKLSKKFPSSSWPTDLDVDLLTLALPLNMCLHISQISSNDSWYTLLPLMRSRRSIHSSLIVLSKRIFSVLDPKSCSFSLLTLWMNLSIRSSRLSSYPWFIINISSLRSWSLYFSRNIFFISFHDLIELVPKKLQDALFYYRMQKYIE